MDVIGSFIIKAVIVWDGSIYLDLAYFVLHLFCLELDVFWEKFALTLRSLELSLACSSRVIVCPKVIPVSLVSKWRKSQLWIEPPRGGNPYNGFGFAFAFKKGHIPSRSCKVRPLRGRILCNRVWSLSGDNPAMEDFGSIGSPRKACKHVCVNTSMWEHIPSRSVQTRSSKCGTSH